MFEVLVVGFLVCFLCPGALLAEATEDEPTIVNGVEVTTVDGKSTAIIDGKEVDVTGDVGRALNAGNYDVGYAATTAELPELESATTDGVLPFSAGTDAIDDLKRLQELIGDDPNLVEQAALLAGVEAKLLKLEADGGAVGVVSGDQEKTYAEAPVGSHAISGGGDTGVSSTSPIVIDLNRNERPDLYDTDWRSDRSFRIKGAVVFDIDGDGKREVVEWMHPFKDGLLVVDKNSDNWISGQKELFGNSEGFENGYDKLAEVLDKNRDGVISGSELAGLKVWIDNGDGVSKPEEIVSVEKLGITRIGVKDDDLTCYCIRNGEHCKTWDWFTEYLK